MNKQKASMMSGIGSAIGMSITSWSALAAAPADDSDVIAEIIVTARKRATALQDVPHGPAGFNQFGRILAARDSVVRAQ